jgi:hypothetical protein
MQCKSRYFLVLLLATGCHQTLPPEQPSPFQGQTLQLAAPAALHELLREQSAAWVHQQKVSLTFSEDRDKTDLWVIPPDELFALAEPLAPVPEALQQRLGAFDWPGLLPLYRERLVRADGIALALPLLGEAPVAIYRRDLYGDEAWQKKYAVWRTMRKLPALELRPPLTWKEWSEQATFFAQERQLPSMPPLPETREGRDRLFHLLAACHARRAVREDEEEGPDHEAEVFYFHYRPDTFEPRLATPGFVYALKLLADLHKTMSSKPDSLETGEPVLAVVEAGQLAALQRQPATRGLYGVFSLPGGDRYWDSSNQLREGGINTVPYHGGRAWLGVVPKQAAHAEAAWDLLAEWSGPRRSAEIASEPRWGAGPTRAAHLLRDRWDSLGLDPASSQMVKDVLIRYLLQYGIKNPVTILRTVDRAQRVAVLDEAVVSVLEGKSAAQPALEAAAAAWAEQDQKMGLDIARRAYRRSLGLRD